MRSIIRWIDEETGLITILRHFLEEPLPKGTGWAHVFGSVVLFLFILQGLTGAFMMIYYTPTPDHAYESIEFIQRLPFGRIVRGLHHWGASAMVIFVGIHLVQVFLWGAYKKPRQITWVIGVFLLLLTFAFSFTGYLLPWDQKAYWATVVGTNIAGSIPVIGEPLKHILRSGVEVGAATLTRFYAIHVVLLPMLITLGIIFHIYQVRKKGITPPWSRVGEEPTEKPLLFYPDQVFKDLVAALIVLMVLLILAVKFGAPLEDRANPADTTYVPRPEWYFLPLFELLKYLPGKYGEFFGAIVIPTVGVILLLLFPYIDRNPERHPAKRPFAVGTMLFIFVATTVLGVRAIQSTPHPKKLDAIEARGEKLFMDLRCSACHGVNGGGGTAGPDLATLDDRNPQRLEAVLRRPQSFNPRSIMPSYDHLKDEDIIALVAYMRALGPGSRMPRVPIVGPKKPASHFDENWMLEHKFEVRKDPTTCSTCHKPSFCQTCHQNRRPDSHLNGWIKAHFGTATERPEFCAVCHTKSYCQDCHKDTFHTPKWMAEHSKGFKARPAICKECHTQPSFCVECHKGAEPKSHTPDWIHRHALELRVSRDSQQACTTCHEQSFCTSCHEGKRPKSHEHPEYVIVRAPLGERRITKSKHALEALEHMRRGDINFSACATCHKIDFCRNCHGVVIPHPDGYYAQLHVEEARKFMVQCLRCHNWNDQQCRLCHSKRPPSHTPNFREGHPQLVTDGGMSCQVCHGRNACSDCHKLPMPHPSDFVQRHGELAKQRGIKGKDSVRQLQKQLCVTCHADNYCRKCHLPSTFMKR